MTPRFPLGASLLVLASLVLAIVTIAIGLQDEPNKLATSILQAVTIILGLVGSFVFGRDQSRAAAREIVRPHAKSAFRRTRNLYEGLGRQQRAIVEQHQTLTSASSGGSGSEKVPLNLALSSLTTLELMVVEQISTADDAMEDWRDLVPDEVAAIEAAAQARTTGSGGAAGVGTSP